MSDIEFMESATRQEPPETGKPTKLNIGAGDWQAKGWLTLDRAGKHDLVIDLEERKKIPLKSGSLDRIYTSHCLEHLSEETVLHILSECRRMLRQGGVFRVIVPDFDRALEAYRKKSTPFFFKNKEMGLSGNSFQRRLLSFLIRFRDTEGVARGPNISNALIDQKLSEMPAERFIEWARTLVPDEYQELDHQNGFTFKRLEYLLNQAGFETVERLEPFKSTTPEMARSIFTTRRVVSLIAEAK